MEAPQYCCPNCHANRAHFELVLQVVQAIDKDARTGQVTAVVGEPEIRTGARTVCCRSCGFDGPEAMFIAEARLRPPY